METPITIYKAAYCLFCIFVRDILLLSGHLSYIDFIFLNDSSNKSNLIFRLNEVKDFLETCLPGSPSLSHPVPDIEPDDPQSR